MGGRIYMKFYYVIILLLFLGCQQKEKQKETYREEEIQSLLAKMKSSTDNPKNEGIAIVLLIDASGSMTDVVREPSGEEHSKINIAKRTAKRVLKNINEFRVKNPDADIRLAIYQFNNDAVVPLIPIDSSTPTGAEGAIDNVTAEGNTPIGNAIAVAKQTINDSEMKSGNIIIISDGENTVGPEPEEAMRAMSLLPYEDRAHVYLVAFDMNASVFENVKKEGAMVSEAQNDTELQQTMDYILYKKILVEELITPQRKSTQ
jgi:Mg-chelatase subunit ChlD